MLRTVDDKNTQNTASPRRFLTSLGSGIFMSLTLLLSSALLIYSYLQEPRPLLAWLAFIPFALGIFRIKSSFIGFLYGMVFGLVSYMGIIYWIGPTVYSGLADAAMANAAAVALSAVLALQFGLFGFICVHLKKARWLFPLAGACAWVALELAHQLIALKFMSFPWFVLGYTQAGNTALIQISAFGGAYAVSFLVMIFTLGMAVVAGAKARMATRILWLILPLILIAGSLVYGERAMRRYSRFLDSNPQKLSVALMQPYTHKLMFEGYEEDVVYTIHEQASALAGKHIDLIIWPESSYPGSYEDPDYYKFLQDISAKNNNAYQITGSWHAGEGGDYVSAALFNKDGFLDVYNKTKLVPFGEFLPWHRHLKQFYDKYEISSFTGTFITGAEPGKLLEININDKIFRVGANICFESLFPSVWRAQAKEGAQFFVNISNDGWFLDSAAPYQHLRANIFRAVENRRPLLRSTNTGISAWVDALGNIKYETALNKQETALINFAFQPKAGKTFYTVYGDIFAYLCAFLALSVFIYCAVFLSEDK